MKRQLHVLSCLLFCCLFAMTAWGQTAFTITYTGLGGAGTTGAVPSPANLFTVALTNTTAYNGVDASCTTSSDGATSYTTTITAKSGYNFTITSVNGTAYASSAGNKGYQVQISSSNSNFTTASSTVGCIGTSSSCGTSATPAIGSLTGTFTTTAGNACTITVLKSKCGSESGGGYSKTKTLVISGTYIAAATGATKLALVSVPTTGTVATNLASFTVEARKADNSVDNTYLSNITLSKASGPGTISGTVTKAAVNGVATFNDIKFSAAGTYTISAASGSLTGATSGNIIVSVPTSAATDYFRSKQSGNWSSTSTWESSSNNSTWINATLVPGQNANTITILATHTVTVDANISVSNTNIASGAIMDIAPAVIVTVPSGKTIANSGTFTLKSDNTGTGSIGNSAGAITGNVTIQRYIPGGLRAFRFLGNPFGEALALTQLTDDIDITGNGSDAALPPFTSTGSNAASAFSYDPSITNAGTVTTIGSGGSAATDPGWVAYTTAAGTVGVGDGFRVLLRGSKNQTGSLNGGTYTPNAVTLDATGTLNPIGNFSNTVTYSASNPSYNLISNPYPSNINLKTATPAEGVNNNFWLFNPHQGTKGGYLTYAFGINDYSLPSFAGFFVQAIAATNNTITFHETDKTAIDTSTILRNASGSGNMVEMSITSGNIFWDRYLLQLDNKGSDNRDARWDADKFANSEVSLYSLSANNRALAVDVRPFQDGKAIPLGLQSNAERSFTLTVTKNELADSIVLNLHDKYLDIETKMEEGMVYQFNTTSNMESQGENRFEIIQRKVKSLPSVQPIAYSIKLSPNPATDILKVRFSNSSTTETNISILNAAGQIVQVINAGNQQNGEVNINVKGLSKGTYYLSLSNKAETKTERFQIQ